MQFSKSAISNNNHLPALLFRISTLVRIWFIGAGQVLTKRIWKITEEGEEIQSGVFVSCDTSGDPFNKRVLECANTDRHVLGVLPLTKQSERKPKERLK